MFTQIPQLPFSYGLALEVEVQYRLALIYQQWFPDFVNLNIMVNWKTLISLKNNVIKIQT